MKVEINDASIDQLQKYTNLRFSDSDCQFMAQCLFDIGLLAVNSALQKHPQLTFRELLMMYFRQAKP